MYTNFNVLYTPLFQHILELCFLFYVCDDLFKLFMVICFISRHGKLVAFLALIFVPWLASLSFFSMRKIFCWYGTVSLLLQISVLCYLFTNMINFQIVYCYVFCQQNMVTFLALILLHTCMDNMTLCFVVSLDFWSGWYSSIGWHKRCWFNKSSTTCSTILWFYIRIWGII